MFVVAVGLVDDVEIMSLSVLLAPAVVVAVAVPDVVADVDDVADVVDARLMNAMMLIALFGRLFGPFFLVAPAVALSVAVVPFPSRVA